MKTYSFLSDPGHGWLKVPIEDLIAVGLNLEKISACSYYDRKQTYVYLEEDRDANVFFRAYKEKFGEEPKIKESKPSDKRSFIRSLSPNHFSGISVT